MDWTKALGYFSNIVTVAAITSIIGAVIYFVPDSDWAGEIVAAGIGGLVGYLKGISTSK